MSANDATGGGAGVATGYRGAPFTTTRRTVLRAGGIAAGVGFAALLTSCSPTSHLPAPAGTITTSRASMSPSTGSSRVLIAYYSRAGENYYYGGRRNLRTGNTEVLADFLRDSTGADVYRIRAVDPYPDSYDQTVARNVREQNADARPAIAGDLPSLENYATILLGSPIWNVRPPMIMNTFIDGVALTGKRLYPFVTYAVSGLGHTEQTYRTAARGAHAGEGLSVLGETVRDARTQAVDWLARIGLN